MSFRAMRRIKQLLPREEALAILRQGKTGVLSLAGDGDYPYAVPLNYLYAEDKIYFHCAKTGHKIDAIRRCPKASFCVVAQDQVVPEEYATHYQSVLCFGTVRIVEDEEEKMRAITRFTQKYCPNQPPEDYRREIRREWPALCILELSIQHMTGKEARALAEKRGTAQS